MPCPDPETLGRWLSGEVDLAERAAIADHAAECAACHQLIDAWCPPTASAVGGLATAVAEVTNAPARAAAGELAIGAHVDRYRILRRLGSGGMGVVYAANDTELGRDVAIKLVKKGASTERVAREAQALARLSHPNVVAVYDVGEHDGRTFIAMALVDGVDLRRWLATPHPVDEILAVIRDACAGVGAAHAAGLVHRDLKPDNIFVAADGGVLVGDFGLARELASDEAIAPASGDALALSTPLTGTGTVLGTPAYMAPEQADGEATAASDQFSLCVTAWEALFGARPFAGATLGQILLGIRAGRVRRPERAGVPARVERALRRGLSADPAARFATIGELVRALAPPRRRWPWLAAAIAAVAAIAGLVGLLLATSRSAAPAAVDCATAARSLDDVWNAGARTALERGLPTPAGAKPVPIAAELDAYAARWRSARRAVCEAAARGEERAETTERRIACLDARRAALARLIAGAHGEALEVWRAAESLPDVDACANLAALSAVLEPSPAQAKAVGEVYAALDELNLRHFGSSTVTTGDVTAARERAEQIGFAPLVADALSMEGAFAIESGDDPGAEELLRRAIRIAEGASYDLGRARASGRLAIALAHQGRIPDARGALDDADAALARAGGDPWVESDLQHARAAVTEAGGDHAAAAEILRRRFETLQRRFGADSITVANAELELANQYGRAGDDARAVAAFRAAQQILAGHGGGELDTVESLAVESGRALQAGDFARSIDYQERAVVTARAGGAQAQTLGVLLLDLGEAYEIAAQWRPALANYRAARVEYERVPEAVRDLADYENALSGEGATLLRLGDPAGAIEPLERSVDVTAKLGRAGATDHETSSSMLGQALYRTGRVHEARELLEPTLRALQAEAAPRPIHVGTAASFLAQALWDDGDRHDRARALALADEAARDLEEAIAAFTGRPSLVTARRLAEEKLRDLATWREHHR